MSDEASTTTGQSDDGNPGAATAEGLASLDVTPPALVRAVTVGAVGYAVTWAASCVATALALVGVSLDDEDVCGGGSSQHPVSSSPWRSAVLPPPPSTPVTRSSR